jgi:two-component system chemotaxis response regulator CheB
MNQCKVVLIGASAGGVKAVQDLFKVLPADLNVAYAVILHIGKTVGLDYSLIYGDSFKGEVSEIYDKMPILANRAYFAPADYHVFIEKKHFFSLGQDEPVQFARPSIDVTFSSAAQALGGMACGVLLTGGNSDGAAGMKDIFDADGMTLVQDPNTADFPIMPLSALELFAPHGVHDLNGIAKHISLWARGDRDE